MFWKFFLGLFIASIIFPFIYAFLAVPALGLALGAFGLQKAGEATGHRKAFAVIRYPLMIVGFLASVYILAGWSAYAAARAVIYAAQPEVAHRWLYYVVGFMLCHGPLGYMASKEGPEGSSGTAIHVLIAMGLYIVFCIWPSVMLWPYGWLLSRVL